jgi:hypothetical protein
MNLFLAFDEVVRGLAAARVRYAVVGGLAVGLHGRIRATEDMDFLVHPEDESQVTELLRSLGYRANSQTQEFTRAGLSLRRFFKRLPQEQDLMVVDILLPLSARMLGILGRAIAVPFGNGAIRVVTNRDLVTMKKLRGSLTDQADIEYLRGEP